jgi:peptidyl-tRNA hydrolase, PTH1 family
VAGEARPASPIRLVVGLGNPEQRYARSRHNAGQMVVEALAERLGARWRSRYRGRYAEARGPAGPLALLVPTTYMNLSGDSVGPASGSLHLEPAQVLVVHDEIDLPFGTVRGKQGGGAGGHNGLRSVQRGLGTPDFPRIRLGVGRPPAEFRGDPADWVLMGFSEPRVEVEKLLSEGLAMAESALELGIEGAIARHHAAEPGSRARERRDRRERAAAAAESAAETAPTEAPEPE